MEEISALIPPSEPLPWLHTQMVESSENFSDDESSDTDSEIEDADSETNMTEKNEKVDTKSTENAQTDSKNTKEMKQAHGFNSQAFIGFADTNNKRNVEIKCGIADLLESEEKYHKVSKPVKLKRKKGKGKGGQAKKGKYETANVGQVVPRPDKKKRKR